MSQIPALWTAVITTAVALAIYFTALRLKRVASITARRLKNHLVEFGRAWFLLAGYYILRFALGLAQSHNVAIELPIPIKFPPGLLWNLFIILICFVTNTYLLRAIIELESVEAIEEDARPFYLRLSDVGAVFWSYVIGSSLLIFLAKDLKVEPVDLALTYATPLAVSSFLFFRLARIYQRCLHSALLATLAVFYGFLQIFYPLTFLGTTPSGYEIILTINKLLLGISLPAVSLHSARREELRALYEGGSQVELLGWRMEKRARLHGVARSVALVIWTVVISLSAFTAAQIVTALPITLARKASFVAGLVFVALLLIQVGFYAIVVLTRHRVRWPHHAEGALRALLKRETAIPYPGWSRTTFSAITTTAGSADNTDQPQVILLHGLFSRGDAAWGLLPAILIESQKTQRVLMIDYRHHLFNKRRRINSLTEGLQNRLQAAIEDYAGPTVIFAHSLGGLLLMRTLTLWAEAEQRRTLQRIRHVAILASPMLGTIFATMCLPWAWGRALMPGSSFVRNTLQRFHTAFPPALAFVGEERALPTFSFVVGSRDRVAGGLNRLLAWGQNVRVIPEAHSVAAVYTPGERAKTLLDQLNSLSRAERLMVILAANLVGRRESNCCFLFQLATPNDLGSARNVKTVDSSWNDRLSLSAESSSEQVVDSISTMLEPFFGASEILTWDQYWTFLVRVFAMSAERRELICVPFSAHRTLLLFSNTYSGLAVVVDDKYRAAFPGLSPSLRLSESMTQPAKDPVGLTETRENPAYSKIRNVIKARWKTVDLEALDAMLSSTCEHVADISESALRHEYLASFATVSAEGSYLAIYERRATVRPGRKVSSLIVHTSASGPRTQFDELKVVAFDINTRLVLQVEHVASSSRCQIWKVLFAEPKDEDETVHVRWMYCWPRCMQPREDSDALNTKIFKVPPEEIHLSLHLPGMLEVAEAAELHNDRLTEVSPSYKVYSSDYRHSRFGLTLTCPERGALLYYKLQEGILTPTSEMTEVTPAMAPELSDDLDQVSLLELLADPERPCTIENLVKRQEAYPQGFLVAKLCDKVVGYLQSCRWDRDSPPAFTEIDDYSAEHLDDGRILYLIFMGVSVPFRGLGIGARLIDEAVRLALREDIREIHLVSRPELVGFYERLGFSREATIPGFLPGEDGLVMCRSIDGRDLDSPRFSRPGLAFRR